MEELVLDTAKLADYLLNRFEKIPAVRVRDIDGVVTVSSAVAEPAAEKSAFELGKAYFGKYSSGDANLSTNYKELLKDMPDTQETLPEDIRRSQLAILFDESW